MEGFKSFMKFLGGCLMVAFFFGIIVGTAILGSLAAMFGWVIMAIALIGGAISLLFTKPKKPRS